MEPLRVDSTAGGMEERLLGGRRGKGGCQCRGPLQAEGLRAQCCRCWRTALPMASMMAAVVSLHSLTETIMPLREDTTRASECDTPGGNCNLGRGDERDMGPGASPFNPSPSIASPSPALPPFLLPLLCPPPTSSTGTHGAASVVTASVALQVAALPPPRQRPTNGRQCRSTGASCVLPRWQCGHSRTAHLKHRPRCTVAA